MWRGFVGEVLKFVEDFKVNWDDEESGCCVFVTEIIGNLALGLDVNEICFTNICLELSLKIFIDKHDTILGHVFTEKLIRTVFT